MKKKLALTVVVVTAMFLMSAVPAVAEGPENAGGNSSKWEFGDGIYIWPAELYIGPDYGAGSTETVCSDGTWIDIIVNATLLAKGHYFSEWWEPFTEKDWVDYKFWLDKDHPVEIVFTDGTTYTATKFIFLKDMIGKYPPREIELVAYK